MNVQEIVFQNRNGLNLSARVSMPTNPQRLIFMEHGLAGHKNEPHFKIMEDVFTAAGYITVNLDATDSLNNSGKSETGITFGGHVNDLEDTISWAQKQPWYREPFAVSGHSLGAAAALLYAAKNPARVNQLFLLSLPWLSGASRMQQQNPADLKIWQEQGYIEKQSKSRGLSLRIPFHFVTDLMRYDLVPVLPHITAETFIIIGEYENELRLLDNKKLFEALTCPKHITVLWKTPHAIAHTSENAAQFKTKLAKILLQ